VTEHSTPAREGAAGGRPRLLVVGIGSELRCDDGVGRHVAAHVAAHGAVDVEVLGVHQLTPELAADLEGRELVVFVDAAVDVDTVTVRRVSPAAASASTHHLDPAALLRLADVLGWAPRRALAVHVPAHDLRLGTELSPRGRTVAARAIEVVDGLLATALAEPATTPGGVEAQVSGRA
jgi:hydrogenase maturation protease